MPTVSTSALPVVLSISGHDPSGGAGIQADIETLAALGCHAATAVTCLTVQDSRDVWRIEATDADLVVAQARAVLSDFSVAAIKIGLLGSAEVAAAIAPLLAENRAIPVVLDPILRAGGGTELADASLVDAICERLLPRTTLLTPNGPEARRLTAGEDVSACAARLLELGCAAVLVSGGHDTGAEVVNRLFQPGHPVQIWRWPRLAGEFHGSGCTLATALAAGLAQQLPLTEAALRAQRFTHQALIRAHRPGRGQALPLRRPRA